MRHQCPKVCLSDRALIQYVRKGQPKTVYTIVEKDGQKVVRSVKKRGSPVGVFIADKVPNEDGETYSIRIGWSRCCKKDSFDRKQALTISINSHCANTYVNGPSSMTRSFEKFIKRCEEYYQQPIQ